MRSHALFTPSFTPSVRRKQTGFTLLELMIVLGIAAIFAAMALPDLSSSIIRGDLAQAQANVSQALRHAKNEARGRNSRVAVVFTNGGSSFTLTSADGGLAQTVQMPSTVAVSSADVTYTFAPLGTVDALGTITLTSARDATKSRSVTIANLLGQITI